jgi:hypothetical protein
MDNYGKGRPSVMKITRLLLDEDGWRGFYRGFCWVYASSPKVFKGEAAL